MNAYPAIRQMQRFAPLALVIFSALVAVGAYLQTLDYPFIFDDSVSITRNSKLAGLHLTELWRLFIEPYNSDSEFLPLRELSFWFDMTLFGQNPAAYRLHNIFLYLLCLPLIYVVTSGLWRYFRPADAATASWAAAAVTALFVLHPALVESVVWISGRKYLLPNLFAMLALWFAINAKRERGLSPSYATAALAAFVAMMLSKASYVAVAPVIALLWTLFWLDIPAQIRHRSRLLWPLAILLLAGLMLMFFIMHSEKREHAYFGLEAVTRTMAVLGWLVRLSISPESRHFFYPVFEDPYLSFRVGLGVAALVFTVLGAVMLLRKRSLEGFCMVVFLLLCMPYLQLVPYAPPSLVSDRFVTLAVWPAILLVVAILWRLRPIPRTALLLVIALPWCFQTFERTRDWRSPEVLVDADLRAYPGYYMPVLYKVIDQLSHGMANDAIKAASSITIPEFRDVVIGLVKAHHAVGTAIATGEPQEAMGLLQQLWVDHRQLPAQAKWNSPVSNLWISRDNLLAVDWVYLARYFPDDMLVHYNTGLFMLNIREYGHAVNYLRAATESQRLPESLRGTAFYNLGHALINSGSIVEAETPLRAALTQAQPDLRAHCLLSELYKHSGRPEESTREETACNKQASGQEVAQ